MPLPATAFDKDTLHKVFATKVYIVFQRDNVAKGKEPNIKVVACKLTRAAAQSIVDRLPGSYIEKVFGNRIHEITPLNPEIRY